MSLAKEEIDSCNAFPVEVEKEIKSKKRDDILRMGGQNSILESFLFDKTIYDLIKVRSWLEQVGIEPIDVKDMKNFIKVFVIKELGRQSRIRFMCKPLGVGIRGTYAYITRN